jgi:hypothetical protein
LTLDYETGMNYVDAWNGLRARGAEECDRDSTIEYVRFTIAGVPDPVPAGWSNGTFTGRDDCASLIDAYLP